MKRFLILLLAVALLWGCAPQTPGLTQYTATFLDLFDTVTTVVGKAQSEAQFQQLANGVRDKLSYYHQLFDIYETYEGLVNLKTVNDMAAVAPVHVGAEIMALLQTCKDYYSASQGKVNVAMGAVLRLWHDARENAVSDPAEAAAPDSALLEEAARHCDLDAVILDADAGTVFFEDPELSLDVGAIAKGWAAQRVAEASQEGLLISVGGNVCATGPKGKNTPWVVGIQDPNGGSAYLHTVYVSHGAVVTSGDYQRYFVADGVVYHHIIDPDTLQPGRLWRSVSVVCPDSAAADMLSTALFLLPYEDGVALLEQFDAQAVWVDAQNQRFYSPGFMELVKK